MSQEEKLLEPHFGDLGGAAGGDQSSKGYRAIMWNSWRQWNALKTMDMKIRPVQAA
jgi:hypothetical protein